MDPLSALSVAGTIVQFADFGSKLVQDGQDLYNLLNGTLPANWELELITANLKSILSKIRKSVDATKLSGLLTQEDHKDHLSFEDVCNGASNVAEVPLVRLDTVKIRDQQRKVISSLRKALENLWTEDEITEITRRLAAFKQALNTRILLSVEKKLDAQSLHNSALFRDLDHHTQAIISTILDKISGGASQDQITKFMQTVAQLVQRLDNSDQDEHRRTRNTFLKCQRRGGHMPAGSQYSPNSGNESLVATFEMLSVLPCEERAVRHRTEDAILRSLRFDKTTHRYEDIHDAYPQTFEWISITLHHNNNHGIVFHPG